MKKLAILTLVLAGTLSAMAMPKAFYVKQDGVYTKYNFGVAGDLKFSKDGKTLTVTGYSEAIDLDKIDYITFDAPIDDLALTPSQQKNKMVEIGEKVNSMVDINDNAELVRMNYQFFGTGWEDETTWEWHDAPCEFDVPEEYWDVHRNARDMIAAALRMAKGNPAAARVFKSRAADLYKAADYFGIYTANYDKEEWEKIADAEYLEIRFRAADADNYVVRLVCSDDFTTWTTKDFDGQMPAKMTVTFLKGKDTLATAVIDTRLVQDKSIDMTLHFDANGYVVDNTMKVTNAGIDDTVNVTVKGEYLCKAVARVDGWHLLDYTELYDAAKAMEETYDEQTGRYEDGDPHPMMAHFTRANADVDVIGMLQAKGKIFGLSKIYDALEQDIDYEWCEELDSWTEGKFLKNDNGVYSLARNDKGVIENHATYLNNYTDVSFYYDGNKQLQGFFAWDTDEDSYSYDPWYDENSGYRTSGYINYKGYLKGVRRDVNWDWDYVNETEIITVSDWYYDSYDDEGNWNKVTVNEDDVLFPQTLRKIEYETMPVLVFPDMTSFALEDFFDEDSFSRLIDDYNDIIDTYLDLTGQERDNDD